MPALLTACAVVVTCLAATATTSLFPTPWQHAAPEPGASRAREHAAPSAPERWRPIANGRLGPEGHAQAVAFSPTDGRTLVSVTGEAMETWDLGDPEHPERIVLESSGRDRVSALGISPDGRTLVTAGAEGVIGQRIDTGRLRWLVRSDAAEDVKALMVGRQSLRLAVSGSTSSTEVRAASLDDEGPASLKTESRLDLAAQSAQFSSDGQTLAIASPDGEVHLWDVSDPGHPRSKGKPFDAGGRPTTALAFSPDGRLLAAVERERTVRLWDVTDTAKPRYLGRPVTDRNARITAVAFSSDTRLLATVGAGQRATLWWR